MLSLACLLTASCGSLPSVRIDSKPVLELAGDRAKPDPDLTAPCADPVELRGYQELHAGPVERFWFVDRAGLVDCGARKAAVQKFYDDRDAGLAGGASIERRVLK